MSISQTIISILTNESSRKVLLSLLRSEKSAQELSSSLYIPLSTTYRILTDLEDKEIIKVNKMILDSGGHHLKVYQAKFNKIILTIDSEDIKVHLVMNESEKMIDLWKKLREVV